MGETPGDDGEPQSFRRRVGRAWARALVGSVSATAVLAGALALTGSPLAGATNLSGGAAHPAVARPATGCSAISDAYTQAVLADSPVAYYRLDETSGPTMCDASTNQSAGTFSPSGLTYGVTGPLLTDPLETAVEGDGSNSALIGTGGDSGIVGNQSFTLEGWFRSTTAQNQVLVAIGSIGNGNVAGLATWPTHSGGACTNPNGSDLALDEYGSSNCWDTTSVGVNLFDQKWHYLAITYDSSGPTLTGYVDGQSLGAETPATTINLAQNTVFVGNWVDNAVNLPFVGDAAQVAVYASALSAARIAAHYAAAEGQAPTVSTGSGTSVDSGTESVSGTVNPNGESTSYHVDYATDAYYAAHVDTYNQSTTATGAGSGSSGQAVMAQLSGLTAATPYDFRIVASNASGTGTGANATFTTAAASATTSTSTASSTSNAQAPPAATSPDLALSVSHLDPYTAAGSGIYQVQVVNRGTAAAAGSVTLAATLPSGITYTRASGPWTCTASGGSALGCRYSGGPIAPGQSAALQITVAVSAASQGGAASFQLSDSGDSDVSDKTAVDLTNVVAATGVAAALTGSGVLYPGAASPLTLALANRTRAPLAPGLAVDFTVPSGNPAGFSLAPAAAGGGWMCSTIAVYDADLIHCADTATVGAAASATPLVLTLKPTTGALPSGPVPISYVVHSAAGAVLAGPASDPIRVMPDLTARARLQLGLSGPTSLSRAPQGFVLALTNPGAGATDAPVTVTLSLPAGVTLAAVPHGTGWACGGAAATLRCTYAADLAAGGAAAPLGLELAGTPGGASPVALTATAVTADAAGPVSASAQLAVDQAPAGTARPAIHFSQSTTNNGLAAVVGAAPRSGTANYTVTVTNQGDGRAGSAPLVLTEHLPSGVAASASGSGWSCSTHDGVLGCAYQPGGSGTVLAVGATTPPLDVGISGATGFTAVPVQTNVQLQSGDGSQHVTSELDQVTVPLASSAAVAPEISGAQPTVDPGGRVKVTLGVENPGSGASTAPVAVALVLPAGLSVAAGYGPATTAETITPVGSSSPPAAITPGGAPALTCAGSGMVVICAAASFPAHAQSTVTVPVAFATTAMGVQTLHAGLVSVGAGSVKTLLASARTAVVAGGVSALGSVMPLQVKVRTFMPDAGPDQELPAGFEHEGGTITPTTVHLDASQTAPDGLPLTFGWVQLSGPPVSWTASDPASSPGGSLPAFPSGSLPTFRRFGYGGVPAAYGAKASFSFPRPRTLTGPTAFSFAVYVTDGTVTRSATTVVTLDPPPPPPPVAPTLCLWDRTAHVLPTCLTSSDAPNRGDLIIAAPLTPYTKDADGDPLLYRWSFSRPTVNPPAQVLPGKVGVPAACGATDALCFHWPAHIAVVSLKATITNGRDDAEGNPEQAVAVVSAGQSPPPLIVYLTGPTAPAITGSTVNLQASTTPPVATPTPTLPAGGLPGGSLPGGLSALMSSGARAPLLAVAHAAAAATYTWAQTGGPTVSNLTPLGSSVSFTAPAPTSSAQTVSFQVTAVQSSGAADATGTNTVTVALQPAAPLAVTVRPFSGSTPPGGIAVGAGGTLLLRASSTGGTGQGYSYAWSVASGGGQVHVPAPTDTSVAQYTPASGFTGVATLQVTVTNGGNTGTATVPVIVGNVPSFTPGAGGSPSSSSSSSSTPCPTGGPLASILGQLGGGADATLTLGPVTLDLGQSVGAAIACSSWSSSSTLSFSAAHVVVGPFTLSGVSATVSSDGIMLNSGTVSAPSNWDLGSGTISTPIDVSFSGPVTGGVTWSGALPWLGTPASASGATTTVTLGASGGATTTATLAASATLLGANVTLNANVSLTDGAFTATVNATGAGATVSGSGTVAVGSDGSVTPSVTLSLNDLPAITGVTISNAQLHWDSGGLTLSAAASLGDGAVDVTLSGAYVDSSDWSATATLDSVGTPAWLPSGVSLSNATLMGTVSDVGGTITFDVKLNLPTPWIYSSSGTGLSVNDLSAEFSNQTPPTACQPLFAGSGGGQPLWLQLSGNASVTLPGNLPAIDIGADACVDPGSSAFVFTTQGFDGWTPFAGVPLTLNGLSLKIADLPGPGGADQLSVTAAGQMTVDGVNAAGTLSLLPDGGLIAVGSIDLSKLGLPIGGTGAVIFSSEQINDLSDTSEVPASVFTGTGLTQSDLTGTSIDADSVAALGSFSLPANLQCLLDQALYKNACVNGTPPSSGNAAPSSLIVSADFGAAVPSITASLSAGPHGLPIFSAGKVGVSLNQIELQISLDGSFSIGAGATLTLPPPTTSGQQSSHLTTCADGSFGCSTLTFNAAVALDLTGPTISMAATVTGCDSQSSSSLLCNFFGLNGLDIGDLSFSLGINFATTPIPTPTFGFSAALNAIPCQWAHTIGDDENGCTNDPNPSGSTPAYGTPNPDPTAPNAKAMSIAVNIADTAPLFALQIGTPNSTTPVLQFGNGALTVDDASIVVSPSPLPVTIGAGPNAVTYKPGFSLDFDADVLAVPISVHAAVDPDTLSVSASATIGAVSLGPLSLTSTKFNFEVAPLQGVLFDLGFSGDLSLGTTTLQANVAVQASTSGPPSFALSTSGGNLGLSGVVAINRFSLSASGMLTDGTSGPLPSFNLQGSASATVLGQTMTLAGGVQLGSGGIESASLYADPGNLSVGGVSVSGSGCGSQAPGLPSTGPCIGASYDASASQPLTVSVNGSVAVNGIGVSLQGTVDSQGLDIQQASAEFLDPLDPSGRPRPQPIADLSGRIWYGSASDLAGATADDPNLGPNGGTVAAQSGDFEVSGTAELNLAGFDVSGNFQFGALKDQLGTAPSGGYDIFANGQLNVNALGNSAMVSGSFGEDASGNFNYSLAASGDAVGFDGYPLGSATLALSSQSGLTVSGSLNLGGLLNATLKGSLSDGPGQPLLYSFSGGGSLNVLGTSLSGQFTLANEDQNGDPLGGPSATATVDTSFDNAISFNGSAAFGTDGNVCDLQGSASVSGFTGTASYCGGDNPSISLAFTDYGYTISGSATSSSWDVNGSVAPGSLNYSTSLLGSSASVNVNWAFNFDVNSNTGLTFNIDGSGTISGSTPVGSGSANVSLSGTPNQVQASASLSASTLFGTVGIGTFGVCVDGNGFGFTQPDPPFSGSCP